MNNIQRLEIETKGIKLDQSELSIYLQEADLEPFSDYIPQSSTNKNSIYSAAFSALESIPNNPNHLKAYKMGDTTVSDFADSLMARIDQLERKIRTIKTDDKIKNESSFFMLFSD